MPGWLSSSVVQQAWQERVNVEWVQTQSLTSWSVVDNWTKSEWQGRKTTFERGDGAGFIGRWIDSKLSHLPTRDSERSSTMVHQLLSFGHPGTGWFPKHRLPQVTRLRAQRLSVRTGEVEQVVWLSSGGSSGCALAKPKFSPKIQLLAKGFRILLAKWASP